MTLPAAWNRIAMDQVNTELGNSPAWARLDMQNDRLRALAGGAAAPYWTRIAMSDLWGKSSYSGMYGNGNDYYYDTGGGTNTQYQLTTHPTVSVAGGSGGYSFNWVLLSGAGGTILNNNSSDPGIRYTVGKFGLSVYATYRCDVTDNTGHVVSFNVIIQIDNNGG